MKDHAAIIRDAARDVLLGADTIAQTRVKRERIDPIQPGEMPALIVLIDTNGQNQATAGTAPLFETEAEMVIHALVEEAAEDDAIDQLDLLIGQVKEALFCSASWLSMAGELRSYRVVRGYRADNTMIVGDARITINLAWRERIRPTETVWPYYDGADVTVAEPPTIGAKTHTIHP